ncbi:MAG: hypothetical protein ACP5JY_03020 [Candidatus Nanoarchaeia archaeon]
MAVKIPPNLIIALFAVLIITIVFFSFFMQILFGGPEIKAAKEIASQIEIACKEEPGYNFTFDVVLPDSKGVPPDAYFFFIAIDDHKLMLLGRRWGIEKNDYLAQFSDFLSCACANVVTFAIGSKGYGLARWACHCREGIRLYKTISLDECAKNNIPICWKDEQQNNINCGKFQFESNEGKEDLLFNISTESFGATKRVILTYQRQPICGDGHCCSPEYDEKSNFYCPKDCNVLDPEHKCTWITTE